MTVGYPFILVIRFFYVAPKGVTKESQLGKGQFCVYQTVTTTF